MRLRVLPLLLLTLFTSSLACAPSEERAGAARERFELALVDGDTRLALEALEDLKAALPDTPESKLELASRLGRAGEMSQALWLLDEATQRYPDHTGLRIGLAETAFFVRDSALTLRALETIPVDDPKASYAAVLRARAQIALGDLETGLDTLERAEARYPDQFFTLRAARFKAPRGSVGTAAIVDRAQADRHPGCHRREGDSPPGAGCADRPAAERFRGLDSPGHHPDSGGPAR